mmetsp:Transcript_120653/g.237211  ORF Transcript_120653/g.237211 Transcript_120653/m.237211 type:complete len:254 (-) Transcript_120653:144-905(-)
MVPRPLWEQGSHQHLLAAGALHPLALRQLVGHGGVLQRLAQGLVAGLPRRLFRRIEGLRRAASMEVVGSQRPVGPYAAAGVARWLLRKAAGDVILDVLKPLGELTIELRLQLFHSQLEDHHVHARIRRLRLVEAIHELVVIQCPGVVVVHEVEQELQVLGVDVQHGQSLADLRVGLVGFQELLHGDALAVVGVHLPHHLLPQVQVLFLGLRPLPLYLLLVPLPRLVRLVDDDGEDEIREAQLHRDEGEREYNE